MTWVPEGVYLSGMEDEPVLFEGEVLVGSQVVHLQLAGPRPLAGRVRRWAGVGDRLFLMEPPCVTAQRSADAASGDAIRLTR